MKRFWALTAVLVAFSTANGGSVGGRVTDGTSGLPVAGAYVEIFTFLEAESVYVATGFADTAGVYAFEGIAEGSYFANSWSSGYATTRFYNVQVPAGGLLLDIVLYLPYSGPGGIVIGTDSGAVASALMVWRLQSNSQEYNISTDVQGRFSLAGLPDGAYQVSVTASGYLPCQFSTAVEAGVSGYGVVLVPQSPTSADETPWMSPSGYVLYEAYPNPFNPATTIRYLLPSAGRVRLEIVDITGAVVRQLSDGVEQAGLHSVTWSGDDLASGIYFSVLSAGRGSLGMPERVAVRKLLLVR